MISLRKTCKFDDLSWDELIATVDCYAEARIDRMSLKEMKQFIFDAITENLSYTGTVEVLETILGDFNEDQVVRIVKEATGKDLVFE